MNMQKFVRWSGLVASFAMGITMVAKGDVINGFGIITASLGSAGVIPAK